MTTVNVLSISGGKDSTAMWVLATKELGIENVLPVFADTGHEHPMTYEYLDYLESELGPLRRVKADFTERIAKKREYVKNHWPRKFMEEQGKTEEEALEIVERALNVLHPTGNPFLDLCLWKGLFPSPKARFCTQFLKVEVIQDQVYEPILAEGGNIVSWQGVRAEESPARAKLPEREDGEGFSVYRPLIRWTVDDVFAIHRKYKIEPNPLYKLGMSRVGCMPCINCGKDELFEIARRFPEEIDRVREWERIVSQASKRQGSTFFPIAHGHGIDEVVEWSKTSYGGKNYDLLKVIEFEEEKPACASAYGLCE